jgi:hypothetical protein
MHSAYTDFIIWNGFWQILDGLSANSAQAAFGFYRNANAQDQRWAAT